VAASFIGPALAATGTGGGQEAPGPGQLITVRVTVGQATADVNGIATTLVQPPVLVGERVLVPFRFVGEALGATVVWDPETRQITAKSGQTTLVMTLDQTTASVDGLPVAVDVPPQLVNGFTMIPLRFFATAFGWTTEWDGSTLTATITGGPAEPGPGSAPVPAIVAGDPARKGTLNTLQPVAWYTFQATKGQNCYITTSELSPGCDTVLTVYDSLWKPLATNDDALKGRTFSRLWWSAPEAGPYFVKVSAARERYGSYSLALATTHPANSATVLKGDGVDLPGTLDSAWASRWYRLDVKAGGVYELKVSCLYETEAGLAAYRDDLSLVGYAQPFSYPGEIGSRVTLVAEDTGVYRFEVYLTRGSTGSYKLMVSDQGVATPVTAGGPLVSGSLAGQQFRWYRLDVEKGKTYTITTFGLSEPFAASLHLFAPGFSLLDYQYGNPGAELTFTAEETAPHYFYVRALSPGNGGSYGVRVVEGGVGG